MAASQLQRIIFGLKVRQFRQEKGWNFEELSNRTGISISYLNEIEKYRKHSRTIIARFSHILANMLNMR
jgi:transcriptional regulator with XRE-family HTH domain